MIIKSQTTHGTSTVELVHTISFSVTLTLFHGQPQISVSQVRYFELHGGNLAMRFDFEVYGFCRQVSSLHQALHSHARFCDPH